MAHHEFTIPFSEVDPFGKDYSFPIRSAWVRGALEGNEANAGEEDGVLEVRVSRSGADAVVHGRLEGHLEVPCARCLQPAKVHISEKVSVLAVRAAPASAVPDKLELTGEEADTIPFDGETVVLDDLVRDELLLAIPMIPLCSEDCPGMSAPPHAAEKPAEPRPIDPRLAPLLRLSKTGKTKE